MPEGIGRGSWEGTIEGTEEEAGEGAELERASPLPEYTTSGSYSSYRQRRARPLGSPCRPTVAATAHKCQSKLRTTN